MKKIWVDFCYYFGYIVVPFLLVGMFYHHIKIGIRHALIEFKSAHQSHKNFYGKK